MFVALCLCCAHDVTQRSSNPCQRFHVFPRPTATFPHCSPATRFRAFLLGTTFSRAFSSHPCSRFRMFWRAWYRPNFFPALYTFFDELMRVSAASPRGRPPGTQGHLSQQPWQIHAKAPPVGQKIGTNTPTPGATWATYYKYLKKKIPLFYLQRRKNA